MVLLEEINKFIFIFDVGILFGKYVFVIECEAAVILNDAQLARAAGVKTTADIQAGI